jgi:hypothetical protein
MNLVLHQFRKDARQFRILLAVWFGLLLLNLAVNLGWAGQVPYSPIHGFEHAANTWTSILPNVIWALVAVLPSLVVLADSPARREGFLATRPLPKRDLFLAKILFVMALIVAPWVLQELVHLAWLGMPSWVIERGTLERLMFTLPVAAGFGAYAALWPGPARWARSLAIVAGSYVVLAAVLSLSMYYYHWDSVSIGPQKAPIIVDEYAFLLALMAMLVWHSRAHRGVLGRWGGLALVAVVSQTAAAFWPWDTFKLRPVDPSSANSVMAQAGFEISPRAISLQKEQDLDQSETKIDISVTLQTKPLPTNCVVEWSGKDVKLLRAGGSEIHADGKRLHSELFTSTYWNQSFNRLDYVAWSSEFPSDVLFRKDNFFGSSQPGFLSLSRFNLPTNHEELAEPLTLRASFEARIFQWRKIADLPLTPGATATDDFGSWKFIAAKGEFMKLFLQRRQIELATAADSRCSSTQYGPLSRMAIMLYDPLRHTAWLPNQFTFNNITRGTDSALAQYFVEVDFNGQQLFTAEALARCRLVIFEKAWVGSVPETWQSSSFTIDEKLQPDSPGFAANNDPLPLPEFNRRVAALKTPAPDASRREVSLYLLEFLRLVDAARFPLGLNDPHTRQLAALVPAHLDLLLDGLPVMGSVSQNSVIDAIKTGATDAQEPAIIAALQREPELAAVLFARGWVDDARKEIHQLAQSPRALPLDALRAIAWFHDPQTYPRLIEEFEAAPSVAVDYVLRTLPGMDAPLDAIVARQWRQSSLVFSQFGGQMYEMFGETFQLALRHGQTSALQRIYLMLDDPKFDEMGLDGILPYALEGAVQMSGIELQNRHNQGVVLTWMRRHRPEDFIFNPALRQFVLQPKPSVGQTTSTGNP